MKQHGSDGIPRQGHEAQYAEELWLEGPSAFWLHPEGPDSDTTPEEWLAKKPELHEMTNDQLRIAMVNLRVQHMLRGYKNGCFLTPLPHGVGRVR